MSIPIRCCPLQHFWCAQDFDWLKVNIYMSLDIFILLFSSIQLGYDDNSFSVSNMWFVFIWISSVIQCHYIIFHWFTSFYRYRSSLCFSVYFFYDVTDYYRRIPFIAVFKAARWRCFSVVVSRFIVRNFWFSPRRLLLSRFLYVLRLCILSNNPFLVSFSVWAHRSSVR